MILIAFLCFCIAVCYAIAEACYERDWPRRTWVYSVAILFLIFCASGFGQASRYDGTVYTVNQSAPLPGAMLPVLALSGAKVQVCSTWNTSGCTSLLQTYKSSTVSTPNQCPTSAQLYNALATACSSTADVSGGWGVWAYPPGSYAYFVVSSYGTYGPYLFSTVTSAGNPAPPGIAQQYSNPTATGFLADPSVLNSYFYQTTPTSNDGIAQSSAQCLTLPYACQILAPALYALTELPGWSQWQFPNSQLLQPSLAQSLSLWDQRGGFYRMYIDPLSNFASQNIAVGEASVSKFYKIISPGQRYNAYIGSMFGENHYANGLQAPYGKTSSYAAYFYGGSFTAEQHYGINVQAYGLAPGDVVSEVRGAYGPAGANVNGDESIEITSDTASQTINVFRGLCATGCTTGSSSITVTPTAPTPSAGENIQGTQGQQRWMTLHTPTCSMTATAVTDNVQQLGSTYGYFTSIAAPTCITPSTGWGLLTSAIAAPPYSGSGAAQIPGVQSFTFSISGGSFTNGLACLADQLDAGNGSFDLVMLSGVSGGTATATFQYVHPAGAAIFQGGQCGQLADIVQDDLPSGYNWSNGEGGGTTAFPVQIQWPVVGSIDGSHLIVWSARPGQGGTITTFSPSQGSQAVNLYYGALVLGVTGANNDLSDDVFTLGPSAVPFTNSASLTEAQYPSQRVGGYVLNVSSWFPHAFGQYPFLINWAHGAQGNDSGILVSNGNPQSEYVGFGGLTPPPASAYEIRGTWQYGYLPHGTFTKGLFPVIPWNVSASFTSPDCLFQPLNSNFGNNGDSFCYTWGGSAGQGNGTWNYSGNFSVVGNMLGNYNFTGSVNTAAGFFSGYYANYAPNNTNLLNGAGSGTSWTTQSTSTGTQSYLPNQAGPPGWGNTATKVTTTGSYFQLQDDAGSTYTAIPANTPWAASVWIKGNVGGESVQFGAPGFGGATFTLPDANWHLYCENGNSGTANLGNIFGIGMVGAETVSWVGMTSAPGTCPVAVPAGYVQGASQTLTPIATTNIVQAGTPGDCAEYGTSGSVIMDAGAPCGSGSGGGGQAVTFASISGAGTGPTVPTCVIGANCTTAGGQVTWATGTGATAAGFVINTTPALSNPFNCVGVEVSPNTGVALSDLAPASTTSDTLTLATPASSTGYVATYTCGGISGPQGTTGVAGATGATGAAGPNTVTTSTATNITGLLKGNGTLVSGATAGTDYVIPSGNVATATNLSTSGSANQVWSMNSGGTAQGWQTPSSFFTAGGDLSGSNTSQEVTGILSHALPALGSGYLNWTGTAWAFSATSGMIWPGGSAGIPNYSGSGSWNTTYNAANTIPANFISTLNQSTTGNAATATALAVTPTQCATGQAANGIAASGNAQGCFTPPGTGTVTTFSSGNLSPLFTTSVATATSTPALAFTLSNAAQGSVFGGPASGGAGLPSFQTAPTISAANMTSFPTLNQNTTGTAANLSGTPLLPNGTSATTQAAGDSSTDLATDAFVANYLPKVSCITVATFTFGPQIATCGGTTGSTFNSGLYYNENATAGTAITGTLPAPVAGKQYCIKNFNNGSAANTGTIEVIVANTGTQSIVHNGTAQTSETSGGAAGDAACFVGVSSTQWDFIVQAGTWLP